MKAESTPRTQMTSLTRASVPSSSDPVTGKSEVAEPGTSATRSSSLSTTSPPSEVLPRQPTLRCLSDEIVQSDEGQPERNSSRKHNSPLRPTLTACSLPRRVLDCKVGRCFLGVGAPLEHCRRCQRLRTVCFAHSRAFPLAILDTLWLCFDELCFIQEVPSRFPAHVVC